MASLSERDFYAILSKTIPQDKYAPFDLELGGPYIHLLLFVHRIQGIDSGIYFLLRNERDFENIKGKCDPLFIWEKVKSPDSLPLYLLKKGDFRNEAAFASCGQEIAGDGVFSLSMIGKFRELIEKQPFLYRLLLWEAGIIGQTLYLGAEARSMSGTGIGCFLDDVVHKMIGLKDDSYQSIYHFTVGKPTKDTRLTTLAPYYHLK
ncbi:MAG: hypothetical protein HY756_06775 [Nitrospirae bacterium]|nr:hypothetical protein [Nitrospirota bacterium]